MSTVEEVQVDDVLEEVLREEERVEDAGGAEGVAEAADAGADDETPEDEADPDPRSHLDGVTKEEMTVPDEGGEERPGFTLISELLGVPLFYERGGSGAQPAKFEIATSYKPILEQTLRELMERIVPAKFGQLKRISSAGTFVSKPGMHGQGRAIDWDRFVFEKLEIAPIERDHEAPARAKRQRYWAAGAIMRANSAFLLHGRYDGPHGDHFHQDNQTGVQFRTSRSTVTLLQAVLNDIYGNNLAIDGDFGTRTGNALRAAFEKVELSGDPENTDTFRRFLRRSGRLGFRLSVGA